MIDNREALASDFIEQLKHKDKPRDYNDILITLIAFHEHKIDAIERDMRLAHFKYNKWQLKHIDEQARNLTGKI